MPLLAAERRELVSREGTAQASVWRLSRPGEDRRAKAIESAPSATAPVGATDVEAAGSESSVAGGSG